MLRRRAAPRLRRSAADEPERRELPGQPPRPSATLEPVRPAQPRRRAAPRIELAAAAVGRRRGRAATGRRRGAPRRTGRGRCAPSSPAPISWQVGRSARRRRGPPPGAAPVVSGFAAGAEPGPAGQLVGERRPPARPGVAKTSRTAPAASVRRGCWACGSHLTQSQSPRRSGRGARPRSSRSSGAWKMASWASTARARPSTGAPVAAQRDPGERAQRQRDRQVRHDRVGPDEPAQRDRAHRLQVLDRLGLRRDDLHGQPLRAERHPDLAEVVVGDPPLPQPAGRGDRPERVRARGAATAVAARCCAAARRVRLRIWAR